MQELRRASLCRSGIRGVVPSRVRLAYLFAFLFWQLPAGSAHAFDFFGLFGNSNEEQPSEPVPDPTPYDATLNAGGGDLEDRLRSASSLIGDQDKIPSGTVGLLSRAQSDQQRLVATLYKEGYYGGTVSILVNGTSYDAVPIDSDLRGHGRAKVAINVAPGPLFAFGTVTIKGADSDSPTAEDLELAQGDVARSDLILQAEDTLVNAWKLMGHPFAKAGERKITANHATRRLDIAITIIPGPKANFGTVDVVGAKDVRADFIASQAAIETGTPYDPEVMRKAEQRLRKLELFDSIAIAEGDALSADGTVPITITVSERKPRIIGAGVTASNTDGIGLEAYWVHRNLFGAGERFRIEGAVSRIGDGGATEDLDLHAAMLFSKPGVLGPTTTFNSKLAVDQEHPDAFRKRSVGAEVGLAHEFSDELTGSIGVETEFSNIRDITGDDDFFLVGLPVEFTYDTRDSRLDPTEGIRATAFFEPVHDVANAHSFFVNKASVAGYLSIDEARRIVFAGRVAAGSIWGADLTDIPADRRFYVGGGGSIRGYGYQAASPRAADGRLIGGRSFTEASLEARIKITDTIGVVPFFDAGGAFANEVPGGGGDWFAGAGIGLRYLTPVGPLRLDVATPLKKIDGEPSYGIYVGIGQSF